MTKVLVFAATGKVGSALTHVLRAQGHEVHGVTRSDSGARSFQAVGVTAVKGDMRDLEALAPDTIGFDSVFLASADAPDQDALEIGVIDMLARNGSPHVVKLSAQSAGLTPPVSFGVEHHRAEQALRESGLPFTILRPTFFQQSILLMKDDIAKKGSITAPMGVGRTAMVHVQDIAEVAAACLTDPSHVGRTYTLTGPEPQGFGDVAAKLSDLLGRKIKYTSPPALIARLVMPFLTGLPRWQTNQIVDLMVAIKHGAQESVTGDVAAVAGHPPRALDSFLKDNRAAFEA